MNEDDFALIEHGLIMSAEQLVRTWERSYFFDKENSIREYTEQVFITPATKRFLMKMKVLWLVERVSKDSDWKHLVADLITNSKPLLTVHVAPPICSMQKHRTNTTGLPLPMNTRQAAGIS